MRRPSAAFLIRVCRELMADPAPKRFVRGDVAEILEWAASPIGKTGEYDLSPFLREAILRARQKKGASS